jgi:CHAT domain-containing protein
MYAKNMLFFSVFRKIFMVSLFWSLMCFVVNATVNDEFEQGEVFWQQGEFAKAVKQWERALAQIDPSSEVYIEIQIRMAAAYQAVGNYAMAQATLQQALFQAQKTRRLKQQVLIQSALGDIFLATQQPDAAKSHLQKNLVLARTLSEPVILAHLLNNLGNALYVLQEYAEALPVYTEVMELAQHEEDSNLYVQALRNQAQVYLKLNEPQSSLAKLETALSKIHTLPNTYDKGFLMLGLGQLALRLHKYLPKTLNTAYRIFNEVLQAGEQQQDTRLLTYAKGFLGQVYERKQRYQEAMQLTQQAIFFAQDLPDILYFWEWQQARLLDAQQDLAGALKVYEQALEHLHPIRTRLFIGQRDTLDVLNERIRPVYLGLADLLLRKAALSSSAATKTHFLKEARNNIEKIKIIELQEYFQDECISAVGTPIDEIEQVLDKHTAILYPILLPNRTELLLTLANGIHQVVVPVDAELLKATVHKWRKNLQFSTSSRFIKQSKQLYEWLIAPLKAQLENINTLVIVPDGPLRTVPLAALYDAQQKRFLMHQFALAITPGLNLTDPRPFPRQNLLVSLNGLSEGVQNFSPLPSVPQEINRIDNLFRQKDILLDRGFLLSEFSQTLQKVPYEMIHIASHGQFDRNPKKTFLLTYDDKLTMDHLQGLLGFSQFRKKPVELLTLSACQTAVGDERAALGLAGVALKAGSRSAIASLWFVNDESTSELISDFYRNLMENPTWSKAKALQQSQQKLAVSQAFRHPAYWAPFLLIGNWL